MHCQAASSPSSASAGSGRLSVLALAWAALMLGAAPGPAQAQDGAAAATLSSSARGVTVSVTPRPPAEGSGRWEFEVVLDTHSADLGDDLVQAASLSTDDGRVLKPMGWTGAPPGGHHRSGVLSFEVPPPRPKAVGLSISRHGEDSPRTFRWQP